MSPSSSQGQDDEELGGHRWGGRRFCRRPLRPLGPHGREETAQER